MTAILALTCACATAPAPRDRLSNPSALIYNGYGPTKAQCFRCHGADATGTLRGPDLRRLVPSVRVARIWYQIENGDAVMPAYRGELSKREIGALVQWMESGFPDHELPAAPLVPLPPQGPETAATSAVQ
jgi:mono/diheme cytochrome c family protein